ncbi:MAG TPA: hypothetical protein DEF07_08505 [Nitrosomonas sp.]|nr:hypothetical protein [Nitrosomonas sp.]
MHIRLKIVARALLAGKDELTRSNETLSRILLEEIRALSNRRISTKNPATKLRGFFILPFQFNDRQLKIKIHQLSFINRRQHLFRN